MIRPGRQCLFLLLIPIALSAVVWIFQWPRAMVLWFDLAVLAYIVLDLLSTLGRKHLSLEIALPAMHSIGRKGEIIVKIRGGLREESLDLALPVPAYFQMKGNRISLSIPAQGQISHSMEFRCNKRGVYSFQNLVIHRKSLLGSWWIPQELPVEKSLKIIPDVESVNTFYRLARKDRLNDLGYHRLNLAGTGMELHHLRPYRVDEDARHIDWKASKRMGRPVSKVFAAESSNQIYFVLDLGRLMTNESQGMSLLDYAINATLLLANIALKMGDSVGIIAVAHEIKGHLPPQKGMGSQKKIMGFLAGLETYYSDTNYKELFQYLHRTVQKRSLVVLFNDFLDGTGQEVIAHYAGLLSRRHLLLFMMLRDHDVEDLCMMDSTEDLDEFFARSAAREYYNLREEGLKRLGRSNILIADVLPREINISLVNRYLALRQKNRF